MPAHSVACSFQFSLEVKPGANAMQKGDVLNLYEVDFTHDIALACGPGAELFFAGVFDGVIPDLTYHSEKETVVVGHVKSEDAEKIYFDRAVLVTPQQMRQAHYATNYSPLDCCRGLLKDLRELRPQSLKPIVVQKRDIKQRLELANES